MPIDTAKVKERRKVEYTSVADVLADAERLSSGPVKQLGNWSSGQVFKHLAIAYNGSIDGFTWKLPWVLRTVAKLFKNKLLNGAMPAGIKLPAEAVKQFMPEPTSTEEGLAELRAAVDRLQREPNRAPHPIFEKITREEWDKIHVIHSKLHMSFLVPQG